MNQPLILASKSPRRKQLLELAEIPFEIVTKETDESFPSDLAVEQIPIHIAMNKARDIQSDHPTRRILAADTIVVLDAHIINKPGSREEAIHMLTMLSGHTHKVITGVVLLESNKVTQFSDVTQVDFHQLAQAQIEYYVDRYQPYDKAGAYAIQEWIGAIAIKRIDGCFYNVMGLPISRVVTMLEKGI